MSREVIDRDRGVALTVEPETSKEQCQTCFYWRRMVKVANPGGLEPKMLDQPIPLKIGNCRRSAPRPLDHAETMYFPRAHWPTTRENEWCGEWKRGMM